MPRVRPTRRDRLGHGAGDWKDRGALLRTRGARLSRSACEFCRRLGSSSTLAHGKSAALPVTVTITSVECTQNDECDAAGIEAAGESSPDFYAKIFINGVATQTNREPDDRLKVEPSGWTASVTVDDAVAPMVPVMIQIWDHDSMSGDDLGDASPQSDHNNLDLVVNLAWSAPLGPDRIRLRF